MFKARLGDGATGVCIESGSPRTWSGTVTGASPNVLVNGLGNARLGDIVSTDCPSCSSCTIQQGSATVLVNGLGTAKLGVPVSGPSGAIGTVISASSNVRAGG
jgi:uncharacterized Zn-binding protein involved in type VI secretion